MSRTSILREVSEERARQIQVEDWTPHHDDGHEGGELARYAAFYAGVCDGMTLTRIDSLSDLLPWGDSADAIKKALTKSPRRRLVIAAALLVAEIERLDRAAARTT